MIGFIEHPQIVTASSHGAIANSRTLQFTTARTALSVCCVVTSRCLVMNPTMSSASVLTFLPAGDCPTTNSLLQLSCEQHLGTDRRENIIPLLLFNCCLVDHTVNTIPLLLCVGCCLATAAVQSPISRSPPSNGSTCNNMTSYTRASA
jgi:hypothetical protein